MIKDNPPPLPCPSMIGGVWGFAREDAFSADQYRAGEAAAFARGVVAGQEAMQEEIAVLQNKLALAEEAGIELSRNYILRGERLERLQKENDELRAKLQALEEQKPVAFGSRSDYTGEIYSCISPSQHSFNEGVYNIPLYILAETKNELA